MRLYSKQEEDLVAGEEAAAAAAKTSPRRHGRSAFKFFAYDNKADVRAHAMPMHTRAMILGGRTHIYPLVAHTRAQLQL